jgi:DNA repair protein RecO (recombination protein O)
MSLIDAIVVGHHDLGESDRIVRLLTREQGRVDLVARRARASKRRFVGLLEVGTRLAVSWRPRGELSTLATAELVRAANRARTDLVLIAYLTYGCELVGALAPKHLAAHKLYQLLVVWLDLLEATESPTRASRIALEAKALTFAGLAPALVRSAVTGAPTHGKVRFDMGAGGAVEPEEGRGGLVSSTALEALEHLRRTPLAQTPGMAVPRGCSWLLADFAAHQLGRELRSRSWLAQVEESPVMDDP